MYSLISGLTPLNKSITISFVKHFVRGDEMVYLLEFHFPYTKETVPKALIDSQELLNHLTMLLRLELNKSGLDRHICLVTSDSDSLYDIFTIKKEADVIMFIFQFKKQYCLLR